MPTQALPVSLEQALYLIRSTLITLNDANRGIAISSNNGTFNVDGGRVLSVSNALAGAPLWLALRGFGLILILLGALLPIGL